METWAKLTVTAALLLLLASCVITHRVEVAPINVTVDVNIKVQKELDDFFNRVEERAKVADKPSEEKPDNTQPKGL